MDKIDITVIDDAICLGNRHFLGYAGLHFASKKRYSCLNRLDNGIVVPSFPIDRYHPTFHRLVILLFHFQDFPLFSRQETFKSSSVVD